MTSTGPGLDDRELHAWQTFFRMQEVLRGHIEQQLRARSGLSTPDYSVLAALSTAPGDCMRIYRLAELLGWDPSRLHHQVGRMVKRGLIERQRDESRAIYVALTPAGTAVLAEAAPHHSEDIRRTVIAVLTPEQLDHFAAASAAILAGLESSPDCPPESDS